MKTALEDLREWLELNVSIHERHEVIELINADKIQTAEEAVRRTLWKYTDIAETKRFGEIADEYKSKLKLLE